MPTPTYDLISEQVLASPASSVTFTSIPQTYKDLVLEVSNTKHSYAGSSSVYDNAMRFNGDTGQNYSTTNLQGDGTNALSGRDANAFSVATHWPMASSSVGILVFNIFNYTNTNMNKTVISRSNNASGIVGAYSSLWRSTAAINRIDIVVSGGYTISAGTTLRLYGIYG